MCALVAPTGKYLWGEGLVWLIGAVVCSLAAAEGPMCAMDGHISAAAPLAPANQLSLPMTVKHGWSVFVPLRCAI